MSWKTKGWAIFALCLAAWVFSAWYIWNSVSTGTATRHGRTILFSEAPIGFAFDLVVMVVGWIGLSAGLLIAILRRKNDRIDIQRRLSKPSFEDPSHRSEK